MFQLKGRFKWPLLLLLLSRPAPGYQPFGSVHTVKRDRQEKAKGSLAKIGEAIDLSH